MILSRRHFVASAASCSLLPQAGFAATPRVLQWDDLIPPDIPYSEIVGEGEIDLENDTWNPIYDENATKLNDDLDGAYIKMPGYIIPIDIDAKGVTSFVLVPYVGACIHTPPPPANQLVFVETAKPWPSDQLWDPVWVTGQMSNQLQSRDIAEIGYALKADEMETYVW